MMKQKKEKKEEKTNKIETRKTITKYREDESGGGGSGVGSIHGYMTELHPSIPPSFSLPGYQRFKRAQVTCVSVRDIRTCAHGPT